MPALSFQGEWLDKLLSGSKQQTTRQQTDRIKIGDVCSIYNQQRRRITDKQMRSPTRLGAAMIFLMIEDEGRYPQPECDKSFGYSIDPYYAHLLGKVKITQVRDIIPIELIGGELNEWAVADGFKDFGTARCWFEIRYGAQWVHQRWTVLWWNGWQERYFEPEMIV